MIVSFFLSFTPYGCIAGSYEPLFTFHHSTQRCPGDGGVFPLVCHPLQQAASRRLQVIVYPMIVANDPPPPPPPPSLPPLPPPHYSNVRLTCPIHLCISIIFPPPPIPTSPGPWWPVYECTGPIPSSARPFSPPWLVSAATTRTTAGRCAASRQRSR